MKSMAIDVNGIVYISDGMGNGGVWVYLVGFSLLDIQYSLLRIR